MGEGESSDGSGLGDGGTQSGPESADLHPETEDQRTAASRPVSRRSRSRSRRSLKSDKSQKSRSRSRSRSHSKRSGGHSGSGRAAFKHRNVQPAGHEDEPTEYDETQWSCRKTKAAAAATHGQTREVEGLGAAGGPEHEMMMKQDMEKPEEAAAAALAAQNQEEAQGEVPGEELQRKVELGEYLERRPRWTLAARAAELVVLAAVLGILLGTQHHSPWLPINNQSGMWAAVVVLGLVGVGTSVVGLAFLLRLHVGREECEEAGPKGRLVWRRRWKLVPVMLDVWAALSVLYAAALVLHYARRSVFPNGEPTKARTPWLVAGALALPLAVAHAVFAFTVFKGRLI